MSEHHLEQSADARDVPRRIALIRREDPARVLGDPAELLPTAPHLLLREVILVQLGLVALAVLSLAFDAPLEGLADPLHTPNPAKAPWYFLGLQELLHYFPPVVAGVLLPGLAVLALAVIPYFRVNLRVTGFHEPLTRRRAGLLSGGALALSLLLWAYHVWAVLVPTVAFYLLMMLPAVRGLPAGLRGRLARVPLADWIMAWFVVVAAVLTLIGVLFRGPGWAWSLPWREGIF